MVKGQCLVTIWKFSFIFFVTCFLHRPSVPVQFQYFLPAYSSSYPLTHTYSSSVSTIRQYPGKHVHNFVSDVQTLNN